MLSLQITWDTHNETKINGVEREIVIRDIPQKLMPDICTYMLENSYRKNVLFKQLKFHETPELEQDYLRAVNHILRDECSIMVVDETTKEIFGVALVKWMTDAWRSWTIWLQILPSGPLAEFMQLQRDFILGYEKMHPQHTFDGLHLFDYYLCDELKNNENFLRKFFKAIREVACHMLMPRVTFVATTLEQQTQVDFCNFAHLHQVIYSLIVEKGRRPYQTLRDIGEMYIILYEVYIASIIPFYDLPPPHIYDEDDRELHTKRTQRRSLRMTITAEASMDNVFANMSFVN